MSGTPCQFVVWTGEMCQDDDCQAIHEICQDALGTGCSNSNCPLVHLCEEVHDIYLQNKALSKQTTTSSTAHQSPTSTIPSSFSPDEDYLFSFPFEKNDNHKDHDGNGGHSGGSGDDGDDLQNLSFTERRDSTLYERIAFIRSKLHGKSPESLHGVQLYNVLPEMDIINYMDLLVLKGEEEKCPICIQKFQIGSKIKRLPCFHPLCSDCLLDYMDDGGGTERSYDCCPVCRKGIIEELNILIRGGRLS